MSTVFDTLQNQFNSVEQSLKDAGALVQDEKRRVLSLLKDYALADIDAEALARFIAKPYMLRPFRKDVYELIIPKFMNFKAGWPAREDGEYIIYQVSRFIDLITPLPPWLRQELGYEEPNFHAHLENEWLVVDSGEPEDVYDLLGRSKHISYRDGKRLKIAPRSKFEVLRQLVRQGVLPYSPKPIPEEYLRVVNAKFQLRPKQTRDFHTFLQYSAVSVFASGGAGKTFFGMYAIAALKGKKIIISPRTNILSQWEARIIDYLPPDVLKEVEFRTYQSLAKHPLTDNYALAIFEEVQSMPADMGMRASQINALTRIGLSATPWREDGNEDIIPALCGVPVGMDWETGKPADTTVWIANGLDEKIQIAREIMKKPTRGKTMIFVYRIDVGNRIARAFDIPFINGSSKQQYRQIQENDTFVISKVGDAGISIDASRVIEFDWLGGRAELGQRGLRTQHAKEQGELHILMTPKEHKDSSKRLSALFSLGFDVKVMGDSSNVTAVTPRAKSLRSRESQTRIGPSKPLSSQQKVEAK